MSKTAAKRQAHKESHIQRDGHGWRVVAQGQCIGRIGVGDGYGYRDASRALAAWKAERVRELMGASRP